MGQNPFDVLLYVDYLHHCNFYESESEVVQSCPTLCNPMDSSLPGSSVHGTFQARVLKWVAISLGIFPTQGSNPGLSHYRQMLYWLSYQESKGNPTN